MAGTRFSGWPGRRRRAARLAVATAVVLATALTGGVLGVSVTHAQGGCASGWTTSADGTSCSLSFAYTGGEQSFTVPTGVSALTISATGARSGTAGLDSGRDGHAATMTATVPVTAGATLYVEVGGVGGNGNTGVVGAGGFNGGANGGLGSANEGGAGGGGASDVRTCSSGDTGCDTLSSRLVVGAGGGGPGGVGAPFSGDGGSGGGYWGDSYAGADGNSGASQYFCGGGGSGGGGATQTSAGGGGAGGPGWEGSHGGCSGGTTGDNGTAGSIGAGGAGGANVVSGGGGGGGYYGGGGGGGGGYNCCGEGTGIGSGGGGGGGSSWAEPGATAISASTDYYDTTTPGVSVSYALIPTPTVTVTSSQNPSALYQWITLTATVSPDPGGGAVTFTDNGTSLYCFGASSSPTNGVVTCPTYFSSTSPENIVAHYSGDSSYTAATSAPYTQNVVFPIGTSTTISSSLDPSVVGQQVTYTALVNPDPGDGTIAFSDGGATIAGCDSQALSGGVATCTVTYTAAGSHSVTANFGGAGIYTGSGSSTLTQTVNKAASVIGLFSAASVVMAGSPVTLTATVAVQAPGAANPTGTVSFADNGTAISGCASQPVSGGSATCAATFSSAGVHSIVATYSGDANVVGSVSPTLAQGVDTNLSGYPTTASGAYNLSNASLSGAYLVNANLSGADGQNAILSGANLSGANLSGANLSNARLTSANLSGANLSGANLWQANLKGANLTGANLTGAQGMAKANLSGVIWSNTTCPDGSTSSADGGTCAGHF